MCCAPGPRDPSPGPADPRQLPTAPNTSQPFPASSAAFGAGASFCSFAPAGCLIHKERVQKNPSRFQQPRPFDQKVQSCRPGLLLSRRQGRAREPAAPFPCAGFWAISKLNSSLRWFGAEAKPSRGPFSSKPDHENVF